MMSHMGACDLSVSNKAAGKEKEKEKECDNTINSSGEGGVVDLGVYKQQLHQRQSRMMMMTVHHDNHHRNPSPSYEVVWDEGGIGPTSNIWPKTSSTGDICYTIGGVSGSTPSAAVVSGFKTLQQPFDTATAPAAIQSTFKSPGMAAAMGFPFTNAQWKELERQAMIYKYMMASIPVPSDLLFPITRNSPAPPLGSGLNLIRFSNGGDLEPGRCRRTDGKKWRCSRDVAPDQKYCERHLHRGRPRSRKPVELPVSNKKKTRLEPNPNTYINNTTNNFITSPPQFLGNFSQYPPHIQSTEKAATVQSVKEQRSLDWMIKGEDVRMTTPAGPEWHCLTQQTGMDVDNSSVLNHQYLEEPLNLNSFTNFSAGEEQKSNECPLFISPDLVSLEKLTPRGFIDAWANGVSNEDRNANSCNRNSVSSSGNCSLSPLSLSMGRNTTPDEDMGQVQMGLGIVESGRDHKCSTKPPFSSWLSPVSWAASTPGGPLAEVLRPITVAASGPLSPTAGNVEAGSPPATAVSSPSGVLQKTIASWSDSSGSSSPSLASSRTSKPEIAFVWSTRGKLESSS